MKPFLAKDSSADTIQFCIWTINAQISAKQTAAFSSNMI